MFANTALAAKIAAAAILTSGAVAATAAVAAPSESTVKTAPQAAVTNVVWVDWLDPRYATTYDINCPDKRGMMDSCPPSTPSSTRCPGDPQLNCDLMERVNGRWVRVNQHVPPGVTDESRVVLERWRGYVYSYDGTGKYPYTVANVSSGIPGQQCWDNHGAGNCDYVWEQQYSYTTYPDTTAGREQCARDGGFIVLQPDGTEKGLSPAVVRDGWMWTGCQKLHQPNWQR